MTNPFKLILDKIDNQRDLILGLYERLPKEKESFNLTVHETAELFNVSHITVRNWIKKGILPAQKIGRKIIIKRSDVRSLKHNI